MTIREVHQAILRNERHRLSIAYTQAVRDREPEWKLRILRDKYERATGELTRSVAA